MSGQNLQRNYTLKLGTLQETIIVHFDRRERTRSRDHQCQERAVTAAKRVCRFGDRWTNRASEKDSRPGSGTIPRSLRGTRHRGNGGDGGSHRRSTVTSPTSESSAMRSRISHSRRLRPCANGRFTETLLNCAAGRSHDDSLPSRSRAPATPPPQRPLDAAQSLTARPKVARGVSWPSGARCRRAVPSGQLRPCDGGLFVSLAQAELGVRA